jgi:hypothetical protein
MSHPIIIALVVAIVSFTILAPIVRVRMGRWQVGSVLTIACLSALFSCVPAIWYGWTACIFGAVLTYSLGASVVMRKP